MVSAGDSEINGKIRYVGPILTAWNSSIWPPAPRMPMARPSAIERLSCISFQPTRRSSSNAGGIMVNAHTT